MNAKALADEIYRMIDDGKLSPDTPVVRPFCMCDQEVGYVEADFLDIVERAWSQTNTDGNVTRCYKHGNSEPGPQTVSTLKLG